MALSYSLLFKTIVLFFVVVFLLRISTILVAAMMKSCPDMLSSFCQQVRTQQIHETKKKEKEYIKLQVSFAFFLIGYM